MGDGTNFVSNSVFSYSEEACRVRSARPRVARNYPVAVVSKFDERSFHGASCERRGQRVHNAVIDTMAVIDDAPATRTMAARRQFVVPRWSMRGSAGTASVSARASVSSLFRDRVSPPLATVSVSWCDLCEQSLHRGKSGGGRFGERALDRGDHIDRQVWCELAPGKAGWCAERRSQKSVGRPLGPRASAP